MPRASEKPGFLGLPSLTDILVIVHAGKIAHGKIPDVRCLVQIDVSTLRLFQMLQSVSNTHLFFKTREAEFAFRDPDSLYFEKNFACQPFEMVSASWV